MQRRDFARLLAGGTIGWLVGGRVAAAGETPTFPNPVPFIGEPGDEADEHLARLRHVDAARTAKLQNATYPQSVASGDPQPHGIVLWTRVPHAAMTRAAGDVICWQISTSTDFERGDILAEGAARICAENDNTIKLPIYHVHGLRPYTVYYYRFIYDGIASRTGRFKTLPARHADIQKLRIGYVNCQDWSNGYYTALAHLAHEDVDVVIHLGDYIYEYLGDGVGGANNGPVRVVPPYPSGGQTPQSLADYRHLWQTYRADANLRAVHELFAYIQLWDDHEFYNDCHQEFHEDTLPPGATAQTPFPGLRQAANQAWCEYGLADVRFDPRKSWAESVQPSVYRAFHFGKLLDLIVTDERLYRDGPPCGDVNIGERYQTQGCANQFSPARTMLGVTQKAWFLDKVTNSKATWKVWANEVMLAQYILGTTLPNGSFQTFYFDLDQWDGYPVERAALLGAIGDAKVANFVALTGDAHLFQASYLSASFGAPVTGAGATPPVGVELLVGATSSGNYLDAGVDAPAPFTPAPSAPAAALKAAATGLPMDALEKTVLTLNPHIQFWNGSTWGYAVLDITPHELTCTFRAVQTVKQKTSPIENLATFKIPAGTVKLIPVV